MRLSNQAGPSITPKLAAGTAANNNLHAVWTEYVNAGAPRIFYSRSSNNGDSWSSPTALSGAPAVVPVIAANGNSVVVMWTENVPNGDIHVRVSVDGGATFSAEQTPFNAPGYSRPSGALIDSAGRIHLAWFDSRATGSYGQHFHSISCTNGASWSGANNVSQFEFSVDNESPRLAEGGDGTIYMFYRSSRDGNPQQGWAPFDHYLLRSNAIGCSGVTWLYPSLKVSRGLPEELGNTYGGQIFPGVDGKLHVGYWRETSGNNLAYRRGYLKPQAASPRVSGFGPVIDISQHGPNHLEFDGAVADVGGFGLGEDNFGVVHAVFPENHHVREGFQVGSLFYRRSIDGGASFGYRLQATTASETMQPHGLYHNGRFHLIWADFRASNQGAEIYYRNIGANAAPAPVLLSSTSQAFPATPVNAASGAQTVTLTNTGGVPVNISAISVSGPFTQTSNCVGSLAPGASCTVNVTFRPTAAGSATGTLTIAYAGGGPATVSLSGFGAALNLVEHYYQSILGRAPDAAGKAFWEGEAARMQSMGVDIKEAYMVMGGFFFNSAEYVGRATSNTQYVTDLYNTFFNRAPDSGGLSYWNGQLGSGLPRNVVMYSFLFSSEFGSFMTGLFGTTTSRAEVYAVVDFYRGILGRLPDSGGFANWLGQFRTAQCAGAAATGEIYNAVESISAAFVNGPEYLGRGRSNTDYVSDLYYAFLRRGGDLTGVNFWIDRLNTGTQTREQMRREFLNSPEFNGRVNAIIAQGCYTGP